MSNCYKRQGIKSVLCCHWSSNMYMFPTVKSQSFNGDTDSQSWRLGFHVYMHVCMYNWSFSVWQQWDICSKIPFISPLLWFSLTERSTCWATVRCHCQPKLQISAHPHSHGLVQVRCEWNIWDLQEESYRLYLLQTSVCGAKYMCLSWVVEKDHISGCNINVLKYHGCVCLKEVKCRQFFARWAEECRSCVCRNYSKFSFLSHDCINMSKRHS